MGPLHIDHISPAQADQIMLLLVPAVIQTVLEMFTSVCVYGIVAKSVYIYDSKLDYLAGLYIYEHDSEMKIWDKAIIKLFHYSSELFLMSISFLSYG